MKKLFIILCCIGILQLSSAGFLSKKLDKNCDCQPLPNADKFKNECNSLCDYKTKCDASQYCQWSGKQERILTPCSCQVKAGFEPWKANCEVNCFIQETCLAFSAFCEWNSGSSSNDTSPGCSCKNRDNATAWKTHCDSSCDNQQQCASTYGAYCFWEENTEPKTCLNDCIDAEHGTCNTQTGICQCNANFMGDDCSQPNYQCPNDCSGNGNCDHSTGNCQCFTGFNDIDCSKKSCPNDCSSHGTCNTATGQCSCQSGWSGNDCSVQDSSSCPNDCSNHGQCDTASQQCICDLGYYGNDCSQQQQPVNHEHSAYLLTWNAWTVESIKKLFAPGCDGLAKVLHLAYAKPTMNEGLSFADSSPASIVFYNNQNQAASIVYKEAITGLYNANGVKTLISVGGWNYRNDFDFLEALTVAEQIEWANKVKSVVDSFGAHGIDIDFEQEADEQWTKALVITNIIGKLRQVMPANQYIIKLSIPFAGAFDHAIDQVPALFSPQINGAWAVGVALPLLKQNWDDLDSVNVMSYSNQPNLDARTCLNITKHSIDDYLNITNSESKLILGGFVGQNCQTGWCNWQISHAQQAAQFVKDNFYLGQFWWPSSDLSYDEVDDHYLASYQILFGSAPQALSVPGICGDVQPKQCPNDCSNQGNCNTATGQCSCFTGFFGDDCSQQSPKQCPNDCSNKGNCDTASGKCYCFEGFTGDDCSISIQIGAKEHSMYMLTWSAWNPDAIKKLFQPACDGLAQVLYIAFASPDQTRGLNFDGQSPGTTVWYNGNNVAAKVVYKEAIQGLNAKGVKTLISIGGWTYRNNFAFLNSMSDSQILAWAQKVKDVVDDFGAQGIDLDFEQDTVEQWDQTFVSKNVVGKLRQVMPAGQYMIKFTIPYGAAFNHQKEDVPTLFNPPIGGSWAIGIALPLLKQNWNDLDSVNVMSYANDPNLDAMQCLAISKTSLDGYLNINNSEQKLVLGGLIGKNGCDTDWCNWQHSHANDASNYARNNNFAGMFWWPGNSIPYTTLKEYYEIGSQNLHQKAPTPLIVPGVCDV